MTRQDPGPRTKPYKRELWIPRDEWTCYVCGGKEPAGVQWAWLYDPDKAEGDRDWRVHPRHWFDNEWYSEHPEVPKPTFEDQKVEDSGVWMGMIKEALKHHDNGELSSRQFANEVEAAIKGWEAR